MMKRVSMLLVIGLAGSFVSGCAALVVGGAGAVIVDEAMEQQNGGDGLF
jgi:hypothetical protein